MIQSDREAIINQLKLNDRSVICAISEICGKKRSRVHNPIQAFAFGTAFINRHDMQLIPIFAH